MATLIHDCPHCHSTKMAFIIVGARAIPGSGRAVSPGIYDGRRATAGLQCQQCWKGASATIQISKRTEASDWASALTALTKEGPSIPGGSWSLVTFWPQPQQPRIPEYLPTPVERAFAQAESNLTLPDHCEAAAAMFRRSLDLALKIRFPDLKGDLYNKIDKLARDHFIPGSLADWAHEVRAIGNDGAHDLDGCTQEDAQAARDFVDAVLRYLFSLPGMIEVRRSKEEQNVEVDEE